MGAGLRPSDDVCVPDVRSLSRDSDAERVELRTLRRDGEQLSAGQGQNRVHRVPAPHATEESGRRKRHRDQVGPCLTPCGVQACEAQGMPRGTQVHPRICQTPRQCALMPGEVDESAEPNHPGSGVGAKVSGVLEREVERELRRQPGPASDGSLAVEQSPDVLKQAAWIRK
jgi:hypothetical protein